MTTALGREEKSLGAVDKKVYQYPPHPLSLDPPEKRTNLSSGNTPLTLLAFMLCEYTLLKTCKPAIHVFISCFKQPMF